MKILNAKGIYFKDLNRMLKEFFRLGEKEILVKNVEGQRYIGDGIQGSHRLIIEGTPGNDMAAYMDGPEIIVRGNAQDAIANTMNSGKVVIYGNAGDTTGYAMRGGEVYVKGNVGYRVGIHMKEYSEKKPVIVIGGKAGDFLGEYMAGGIIILLGLNEEDVGKIVGNYCGTGMHGGTIYIRSSVDVCKLGKEVRQVEADDKDMDFIGVYVKKFSDYFGFDYHSIMDRYFTKLYAYNKRPYGNLYAY
ncbi:MAG: hypothetical protein HPY74_12190 [Firmicutes bacterium]|nr:hypothetical protein [Bacillota bacterium]